MIIITSPRPKNTVILVINLTQGHSLAYRDSSVPPLLSPKSATVMSEVCTIQTNA